MTNETGEKGPSRAEKLLPQLMVRALLPSGGPLEERSAAFHCALTLAEKHNLSLQPALEEVFGVLSKPSAPPQQTADLSALKAAHAAEIQKLKKKHEAALENLETIHGHVQAGDKAVKDRQASEMRELNRQLAAARRKEWPRCFQRLAACFTL